MIPDAVYVYQRYRCLPPSLSIISCGRVLSDVKYTFSRLATGNPQTRTVFDLSRSTAAEQTALKGIFKFIKDSDEWKIWTLLPRERTGDVVWNLVLDTNSRRLWWHLLRNPVFGVEVLGERKLISHVQLNMDPRGGERERLSVLWKESFQERYPVSVCSPPTLTQRLRKGCRCLGRIGFRKSRKILNCIGISLRLRARNRISSIR